MTTFQEALEGAEAELAGEAEGDDSTDTETDPADAGGTTDDGDGGASSATTDTDLFEVVVDGETIQVPVDELVQGYQRQSDYTRKTQALAAERQELEAARALATSYQNDPSGTIRALAEHHGITLAEATAVAEDAAGEAAAAGETGADPRVDAMERRFAELDAREARAELEGTLDRLAEQHGEGFDRQEVVARAIELQTTDLELAYKAIVFDRNVGQTEAQRIAAEAKAKADADAVAAKTQAAGQVSTGGSHGGAGSASAAPITSVAEAMRAAEAEHGFEWS